MMGMDANRLPVAFVHVCIVAQDRARLEKNRVVLVEGDRVSRISTRDNWTIPDASLFVMGLGKFLISCPFRPGSKGEDGTARLRSLGMRIQKIQEELGLPAESKKAAKGSSGPHPFGIVEGEKADLLLLKANPLESRITGNDIAGLMVEGVYYSEMQIREGAR
jgi:hypothetical protein